jgi:hypothetical protein
MNCFLRPVEHCIEQRRMTLERCGDIERHTRIDVLQFGDDARQVPVEVQTQSKEVRNYDNACCATLHQPLGGFTQVRPGAIEERRLGQFLARPTDLTRQFPHGYIRRFDRGTVSE